MCPNVEDLSAYLDRELSPKGNALLTSHLQHCRLCRQKLASLRRVAAAMGATELPPLDVGGELQTFHQRYRCHRSCSWIGVRAMAQAGLSLAAAAVFFAAGLLLSRTGASQEGRALATAPTVESYSPQQGEWSHFQQKLQTVEASFEVTLPGDFHFSPPALTVGADASLQKR